MLEAPGKVLNLNQRKRFEDFGGKVTRLGGNFAVCDVEGQVVFFCDSGNFLSNKEQLQKYGREALEKDKLQADGHSQGGILQFGRKSDARGVVLRAGTGEPEFVALIDLGDAQKVQTDARYPMQSEVFVSMLELFAENYQAYVEAEGQIEMFSSELSEVYEELILLHRLSTNMKINESDANYLQMACDSLTDIVLVEGIAILLKKVAGGEDRLSLVAGSGLVDIDDQMAAVLYNRLADEISESKEALLDSEVDSPFRYDWPAGVKSIIAVPLCSKKKVLTSVSGEAKADENIMGLMVAVNRINKPDFDCPDAKLFNSVANSCAVFVENGRLFGDLKELFIGSLKALTNSIDAKDEYTRGHSERVAYVCRWIAERLEGEQRLSDEQIHKVYLAGLLHDIGKLGIDETVLRKKGKLTEEEFARIKMHPSIGAGILSGIKQMRDIVPGVLSHHERIDGGGYPNGWTGDKIPLIGKIISVADSFDAMTSRRTYRNAMTLEQAIEQIELGLDTQFDKNVGHVFVNSDVAHLWDILQNGLDDTYNISEFTEYGAVAVGALIR